MNNRVFIVCIDYRQTILIVPGEQGSIRTERGLKLLLESNNHSLLSLVGGFSICNAELHTARRGKNDRSSPPRVLYAPQLPETSYQNIKSAVSCVHLFAVPWCETNCCCVFFGTSETLAAIVHSAAFDTRQRDD